MAKVKVSVLMGANCARWDLVLGGRVELPNDWFMRPASDRRFSLTYGDTDRN